MSRSSRSRLLAGLIVVGLTLAVGAAPALAQQQREVRRTFSAREGVTVDLENLAGMVTVEGTNGGDIEVVATINAESGDRADAQTLLGLLEVTFNERGGRIDVRAEYPVERFDRYRYPQPGHGSYNTQTTYQRERVRVTSRDDDDAVTLWVDFVVRVPGGVSADIENHVGGIAAADMRGDFRADAGSGEVRASNVTGDVDIETGSGDVIVDEVEGGVAVDTGSGDVEVSNVRGSVSADTGSGDVTVTDVEGGDINADTGSGDVSLQRVSGDIYAETGSGEITGRDIVAGASIAADTGSGDVSFSGDLSGARQIEIDTSSGDVELDMSAYPGMSISIETGSGSIDVDLPNLQTARSRRNYFRGTVGDGNCDVVIDTGSGSVRIRAR